MNTVSNVATKIVDCLCESNTSPSLGHSFFTTLASKPQNVFLEWMPQWILQVEELSMLENNESSSITTTARLEMLSSVVSAYAQCCCCYSHVQETVFLESIADTYNRLVQSYSRTCMLREFLHRLEASSSTVSLLTPLMVSCVLNLYSPCDEKMLFLQGIWRKGWMLYIQNNHAKEESTIEFLVWMLTSLHLFLSGIPNETKERQTMSMELAYQWLMELANMMKQLSNDDKFRLFGDKQLGPLLSTVLDKILSHFAISSSNGRFAMEPLVDSLCHVVSKCQMACSLDRAVWYRLGTLVLSTPIQQDVCCLLKLLNVLPNSDDEMVQGMLYSLACIYANDDECKGEAKQLLGRLKSTTSDDHYEPTDKLTSIVHLFCKGQDKESLLKFMTTSLDHIDPVQVSALDQTSALLLGCSLLRWKNIDQDLVHSYLKSLLQRFPHLGITLLPILFQSIETACDNIDGGTLLHQLGFLCDAVVKDPNCAQQVWSLVGVTMIQPDISPTSVRSAAIRFYPKLCANNKKLYRRVIDTLGRLVDSAEPEIRLAVAATIDDLAREDRIRDVSDVIGWIQTYLTDENASVVHFAVLSLHHLVLAQELDFDLVIKVLNKRLCPVGDVDKLLALPGSVLEALVLLLGDGECDNVDSDEDEVVTKASKDLVGVSPQVSAAVSTLILLAKSDSLHRISQSSEGAVSDEIVSHTRLNICRSLSNYSLHSLGLDEEGARSATVDQHKLSHNDRVAVIDSGLRYIDIKKIVSDEIQNPSSESDLHPTVSFARKILSLEEESLGSSLWQKRGKTSECKPDRTRAPKAAFSALPSPDQIQTMYFENPSFSTSVASLLSFSGRSVEDLFEFASDVAEDLLNPIYLIFNLQGWLRAMSMIWGGILASDGSSKLDAVTFMVEEVNGWQDLLDNADISHLSLAAFIMFVPDTLSDQEEGSQTDLSQIVERIRNDIFLAHEGHQFESRNMSDLSLGMVAARAIKSCASQFVEKSILALEQSIFEHSGQASLGASYGLALIAQTAAAVSCETDATAMSDHTQQISWINRIVSLLVHEIQSCFEKSNPAFVTLVACLKTGKPSPDLLSSISSVAEEVVVPEASEQKARCLLLSLAICVQAVGIVSADGLLCLYKFIEKLPWGIGKGFVIPCAALQCVSTGVLRQSEMDIFIAEHERLAEELSEEGETKYFNDMLYACIAIKTYLPSKGASSDLFEFVTSIVRNKSTSMSDDCYSSLLLSATTLISTFPCLANGGQMFCSSSNLHPQVTKEKVSEVVSLLTDVSKGSGHAKSTSTAIQSLGLLASIKAGPPKLEQGYVLESNCTARAARFQQSKQNEISLERLPNPQEGTLLETVINSIRQTLALANANVQGSTADLSRLLSCLESLSLPSEFARSFIEPMLATNIDELKPACAALLVSQVGGRRRASFDGRDFVKLVTRLSLLPPSSFQTMMGKGSGPVSFLSSIHTFLPKVPNDNVEAVLQSLWKICEAETVVNDTTCCSLGYLHSLSLLVETKQKKESSRLSPRTYSVIVQVLLQTVFPVLFSGASNTGTMMHSIERPLLDCLSSLQISVLEENRLFALSGDKRHGVTDLSRAYCIVGLVGRQYFEQEGRSSKELLKVVAWFANERGASAISDASLRELAFRISIATKSETLESKKDIMSLVFEALHVHGLGSCLELLGMLASRWSTGPECDPESSSVGIFFNGADQDSMLPRLTLSNISKLLLNDAPRNMGEYGLTAKLKGLIANTVLRIYKSWAERGVAQQDLSVLEDILIRCRTLEHTKAHELTTLMISQLTTPFDAAVSQRNM